MWHWLDVSGSARVYWQHCRSAIAPMPCAQFLHASITSLHSIVRTFDKPSTNLLTNPFVENAVYTEAFSKYYLFYRKSNKNLINLKVVLSMRTTHKSLRWTCGFNAFSENLQASHTRTSHTQRAHRTHSGHIAHYVSTYEHPYISIFIKSISNRMKVLMSYTRR